MITSAGVGLWHVLHLHSCECWLLLVGAAIIRTETVTYLPGST